MHQTGRVGQYETHKNPHTAALRSSVPESHCWHLLEHAGRFIRGTAASGQNADSMPHYTLRPSHTSVLSAEERRDRIWLDSSQRSACTRAHTSQAPLTSSRTLAADLPSIVATCMRRLALEATPHLRRKRVRCALFDSYHFFLRFLPRSPSAPNSSAGRRDLRRLSSSISAASEARETSSALPADLDLSSRTFAQSEKTDRMAKRNTEESKLRGSGWCKTIQRQHRAAAVVRQQRNAQRPQAHPRVHIAA